MLDLVVTPLRFLTKEGIHNVAKVVQQPTMSIRQDGTHGHAAPFVRGCDL